jgi:uncharacterized protein (UPF0335 family)
LITQNELQALPESAQLQFFATNIEPIQDEETRIAREEIEILKTAKARGVQLPEQMYSQFGIK